MREQGHDGRPCTALHLIHSDGVRSSAPKNASSRSRRGIGEAAASRSTFSSQSSRESFFLGFQCLRYTVQHAWRIDARCSLSRGRWPPMAGPSPKPAQPPKATPSPCRETFKMPSGRSEPGLCMRPAERRTIHRPTGYLGYGRDDCDCGPHIANRQLDVSRSRTVQVYLDFGRPGRSRAYRLGCHCVPPHGQVAEAIGA